MPKYKNPIVVFVIVLLLLTGCGGGNKPSTTLKVDMTDFQFTPGNFIVPAGQEITFTANNSGAVVHQFIIMKLGTTVGDDFNDDDLANVYWRIEVQPGSSATDTFTAPAEAGEYQVVCGTPGHFKAGMVAKLIVIAP